MNPKFLLGLSAFLIGVSLNHLGDRLLGVKLELFFGVETFSLAWVLDLIVVPFIAGFAVSWIYGKGGMWISFFPPLFVRSFSYYEVLNISGIPNGAILNSISWWLFFVIVAMQISGFGGIIGEVVKKKTYGRSNLVSTEDRPVRRPSKAKDV